MSGNNIVYVAPDEKSKIYRKLKTASLHGVHLSKAFISAAAQGVCLLLARLLALFTLLTQSWITSLTSHSRQTEVLHQSLIPFLCFQLEFACVCSRLAYARIINTAHGAFTLTLLSEILCFR